VTIGEIVRVVIDPRVGGLVLIFFLARSHPARELGRCISIEIRWRYMRWKGVPTTELQRLLRDAWNDDDPSSEPPATI